MRTYDGELFVNQIKILAQQRQPKVTITKLEADLGISKGYYYKWVESAPGADILLKIADYFDVSVDELLLGSRPQETVPNEYELYYHYLIEHCTALDWKPVDEPAPIYREFVKWARIQDLESVEGTYCYAIEPRIAVLAIGIDNEGSQVLRLLFQGKRGLALKEEQVEIEKLLVLLSDSDEELFYKYSNRENREALKIYQLQTSETFGKTD